jgi:hypothetical protein
MPLPCQLTDDEARQLAAAVATERRAQQSAEIAITRARLPVLEAAEAKAALLDQLAHTYAFANDRPLQFDPVTRTLAEAPPSTNGSGAR